MLMAQHCEHEPSKKHRRSLSTPVAVLAWLAGGAAGRHFLRRDAGVEQGVQANANQFAGLSDDQMCDQ
jgi:hypothetical protein